MCVCACVSVGGQFQDNGIVLTILYCNVIYKLLNQSLGQMKAGLDACRLTKHPWTSGVSKSWVTFIGEKERRKGGVVQMTEGESKQLSAEHNSMLVEGRTVVLLSN